MYKRYVPTLLTAAVVLALIAGMGRAGRPDFTDLMGFCHVW